MSAERSTDSLLGREAASETVEPAQRTAARIVGAVYVLAMATGVFGESFVRGRLIVRGNPAATAQNIVASERLFRFSIAGDLLTYVLDIVLIWAFYVLVRRVNRNLALLAAFFRLVETAVLCAATVGSLVLLRVLKGAELQDVFSESQRSALAALAIGAQGFGMSVGFVFLGLGSTVYAYLLLKSRYVPRVIPAWGIFSSLVLSLGTWAIFVFPGLGKALGLAYMMPMGLYEVGLGLWLLVKGIQAPPAAPAAPGRSSS